MSNTKNRSLDRAYFRVFRDGKYQVLCFSDLTEEEMDKALENRNSEWLKNMCKFLGKTLKEIGDTFNITTILQEESND